jgi:hypothetical protein
LLKLILHLDFQIVLWTFNGYMLASSSGSKWAGKQVFMQVLIQQNLRGMGGGWCPIRVNRDSEQEAVKISTQSFRVGGCLIYCLNLKASALYFLETRTRSHQGRLAIRFLQNSHRGL